MAVLTNEGEREFANQLAHALGYPYADIIIGSPLDAVAILRNQAQTPLYILIDIDDRSVDILPELDALAENCEADTRVVVIGSINDVTLYREMRSRGVIEYFTKPAKLNDVRGALMYQGIRPSSRSRSTVVSFMSAASGDGSSSIALNTAYCLAKEYKQSVVIIDMDFQFGMIARNLDLNTPFGIKELFEHPDRSIDSTLIERMLVDYGGVFKVIAAPNDLRLMPQVKPETIRDLILTLEEHFQFILIDLPHIWAPWVAAALANSSYNIMVAQLWLRSVTHSARLMGAWRDIGIDDGQVGVVINRSGAKFKEGVTSKDYERILGKKIDHYLANDIKTIMLAENQGKTVLEVDGSNSQLARQLRDLASKLITLRKGEGASNTVTNMPQGGGLARLIFRKD